MYMLCIRMQQRHPLCITHTLTTLHKAGHSAREEATFSKGVAMSALHSGLRMDMCNPLDMCMWVVGVHAHVSVTHMYNTHMYDMHMYSMQLYSMHMCIFSMYMSRHMYMCHTPALSNCRYNLRRNGRPAGCASDGAHQSTRALRSASRFRLESPESCCPAGKNQRASGRPWMMTPTMCKHKKFFTRSSTLWQWPTEGSGGMARV